MYLEDKQAGITCFAIVGHCISVAAGYAWGLQISGLQKVAGPVAVAWLGDSAPETGQFWESLNLAATHSLPLLIVIEDNGYATQTPLAQRQPGAPLERRLLHNVSSVSVADDRNGVENVWAGAREARAAAEIGPAALIVRTYRYCAHVGMEDDGAWGYRPQAEIDAARKRDPVEALATSVTVEARGTIEAEVDAEIQNVFNWAEARARMERVTNPLS